jgi:hypothetical protein
MESKMTREATFLAKDKIILYYIDCVLHMHVTIFIKVGTAVK